jgi:hypothetical protein
MQYAPLSSSSRYPNAQPFIGVVETTEQALRLVHAAWLGIIPRVLRRLNDMERNRMIVSGAVFIFSAEESGIRRWTDGRLFLSSRIDGNFLVSIVSLVVVDGTDALILMSQLLGVQRAKQKGWAQPLR